MISSARIALDSSAPGIPTFHDAVRIEQEDGVIFHAGYQFSKMLFNFFEPVTIGMRLIGRGRIEIRIGCTWHDKIPAATISHFAGGSKESVKNQCRLAE